MLHFAYASNMSRELMRPRCPGAVELGPAFLEDHRFFITADGFASVASRAGARIHGVFWRLTPRDRVALDRYEGVSFGLYRPVTLSVRFARTRVSALVYFARSRRSGRPKPGYMELVWKSARDHGLPGDYVAFLARWLPERSGAETGELG
jgi:hypothetical protein